MYIYQVAIGGSHGEIKVYDANKNLAKSFQAHTSGINRIKQSPFNKSYVATCSYDKTVKIWNNNWNLI